MIPKKLICLTFIFCVYLLSINSLYAQPSLEKEYKLVGKDSMKYAMNERGDTVWRMKMEGANLRLIQDGKSSRVVNAQNETIFEERNPQYPNGQNELFRFLGMNIRYPRNARQDGAQGTVYVGFVVDVDGRLTDVHSKAIIKTFKAKTEAKQKKENSKIPAESYEELEEEAVRVVKLMPKWTPGTQQNKPVRVSYTLPIKFKLE